MALRDSIVGAVQSGQMAVGSALTGGGAAIDQWLVAGPIAGSDSIAQAARPDPAAAEGRRSSGGGW